MSQILQKVGKAATRAMAESTIQNVTNAELLELNRRKINKANRVKGNYGVARYLGKEVIEQRKDDFYQQQYDKEWIHLLRWGPDMLAPKPPPTPRKRATAPAPAPPTSPIRMSTQKKKKLVVKLGIRVTSIELELGQAGRQRRGQHTSHELGDQVTSGISQSGRGMRIKRVPKKL